MEEPHTSWPQRSFAAGLLTVAVFVAFGSSLRYGFAMLDDRYLVYENLAVRGLTLTNLRTVFSSYDPELYIPLTFVSYQLNYLMGGLHAGIYHFTNLLLHAGSSVLVAWLALLLLKNTWAALLCGLLFAIHPLHTEAVVWVAGRKDTLSTFFALLTFVTFSASRFDRRHWMYWLGVAFFLLALLSKVMVLTLPALMLLIDWMMTEERMTKKWWLAELRILSPFLVLSAVFAIIATYGKTGVITSATPLETLLMAPKSAVFYLQKFILPTHLTVTYAYERAIHLASPDFAFPIIVLAVLIILSIIALRWSRWPLFALLFYWISLSPTFLNIHKGETAYFAVDRYAYLPSVGVFLLVVVVTAHIAKHIRPKSIAWFGGITVVGIGMASLLTLSVRQTAVWRSDKLLFERALALYPDSMPVRVSLSVVYREAGRIDDELQVFREGLAYGPKVAYELGIGSVYVRQGKLNDAREQYERARALDPKHPEPSFYLGALDEQEGKVESAVKNYQAAIALDASYVAARINLGSIFTDQRKLAEAEEQFRVALDYHPSQMEAHYNLWNVLELQKRAEEAFPHLEAAYALHPDSPDILLAVAWRYIERGRADDALGALYHLLALEPENAAAKRMLAYMEQRGLVHATQSSESDRPRAERRREERGRVRITPAPRAPQ